MNAARTINVVICLVLISVNINVHAARPSSLETVKRGVPRIVASHVVLMNAGQPVCRANLAEMPTLKPKFIDLGSSDAVVDQGPLANVRACADHELVMLRDGAALIGAGNQVAAFPLVVVPVAVCLAGAALGSWGAIEARRLMMTDGGSFFWSIWGVSGGAQALAWMGTGIFNAPLEYAAAYGGLVGATCGFVGSAAGMLYYEYKK